MLFTVLDGDHVVVQDEDHVVQDGYDVVVQDRDNVVQDGDHVVHYSGWRSGCLG